MSKVSERTKLRKIKDFFKEKESPNNINMLSLEESFPEGFWIDGEEDIVSLFYIEKRIATFNSTKIVVKTINDKIKEFQKNKHKHNR